MTRICIENDCDKRTSYNLPNKKTGIYCATHKKENMVHVANKKCIEKQCDKQPKFNLRNEKVGIYCKKHAKENMVDVKSKKCLEENCNKQPAYNLPNEKIGVYCKKHSKENMVNVVTKKCLEENCFKQPIFNLPNKKIAIYCKEHAKENMIDVKNKSCLEKNCNKQPNYNLRNEKIGIYCAEHAKENMTDIINKRCLEENCDIRPSYNFSDKVTPIYCNKHKLDNMINIKDNKCKNNCGLIPSKTNKCKGYCVRCFINLFPNEKVSKNYKIREVHMTDFIKKQFKNEILIFDKQTGGCSKRRPDCYIDKFTHIVIIECDENQHKDTSCENMRTMELFQDFCNRPMVFIRFNPDTYINKEGKKILSSFKYHKILDVPVIRDKIEWNNRLELLKESITKWLIKIPEKEVTNEYLFYDN